MEGAGDDNNLGQQLDVSTFKGDLELVLIEHSEELGELAELFPEVVCDCEWFPLILIPPPVTINCFWYAIGGQPTLSRKFVSCVGLTRRGWPPVPVDFRFPVALDVRIRCSSFSVLEDLYIQ